MMSNMPISMMKHNMLHHIMMDIIHLPAFANKRAMFLFGAQCFSEGFARLERTRPLGFTRFQVALLLEIVIADGKNFLTGEPIRENAINAHLPDEFDNSKYKSESGSCIGIAIIFGQFKLIATWNRMTYSLNNATSPTRHKWFTVHSDEVRSRLAIDIISWRNR